MKYLSKIFLKKNNLFSDYLWNIFAATLNSFQSVFFLFVISRGSNGISDSAVFIFSFAIANLLMMIGKYGMRNLQVSDVNCSYVFEDYKSSRKISVSIMMIICLLYAIIGLLYSSYSIDKFIVIIIMCSMRAFDSYEDVYHGELQKHGFLGPAAKNVTVRLLIYYFMFSVLYILWNDLAKSLLLSISFSSIISLALNYNTWKKYRCQHTNKRKNKIMGLIKKCFPYFLCSFMLMYFSNAPKYAAELYLSETLQAQFNYIFMPVFVICLLGNYVFQPLLRKTADMWINNETSKFINMLFRQIFILLLLTLLIIIIASTCGIPLLNLFFNNNLSNLKIEFLILLVAGGLLAVIYFLNMILTITQSQYSMVISFAISSILMKYGGDYYIIKHSIIGISVFYCLVLAMQMVFMLIVVFFVSKKRNEVE